MTSKRGGRVRLTCASPFSHEIKLAISGVQEKATTRVIASVTRGDCQGAADPEPSGFGHPHGSLRSIPSPRWSPCGTIPAMTNRDDGLRDLFHVRDGDAGRALVFVHGFASAHDDFRPLMDAFRDRHAVVACDLRGHGGSTGFDSGHDIVTAGMDVAGLVERLDIGPAVLVGHSMGCRVVLETASQRPDLVASVVFIEGSRTAAGDEDAALAAARSAIDRAGYAAFVRAMFEGMFFEGSDQSVRDRMIDRASSIPEDVGRSYLESMMVFDAARMESALSRLECGSLLVQSTYFDDDLNRRPLAPGQSTPWTELVERRATRSQLHVVSGVGHFTMLEAPERVKAVIDRFVME